MRDDAGDELHASEMTVRDGTQSQVVGWLSYAVLQLQSHPVIPRVTSELAL